MSDAADPLAALRAAYAKKLPDKMQELADAVSALGDGGEEALSTLRGLVHKLAGSAPTFGYPELGDAARSVERDCDALLAAGEVSSESVKNAIQALVDDYGDGASQTADAAPVAAAPNNLSGHVLVVDDEPAQAMFVQILLKKAGLDVTVENDPLKVDGLISDINPGLILLDMNMPGMNGDELASQIRARGDEAANATILMLSGEEDPKRRADAEKAGANGFIDKPVRPDTLLDKLKPYL